VEEEAAGVSPQYQLLAFYTIKLIFPGRYGGGGGRGRGGGGGGNRYGGGHQDNGYSGRQDRW
jgi:ATP-dependent RNA helicase DDX5/DBP2